EEVLLSGVGSVSASVTVTLLSSIPDAVGWRKMVKLMGWSSGARLPRFAKVRTPLTTVGVMGAGLPEGGVMVAETKVAPAGRGSVIISPVAVAVPIFEIAMP